MSFVGSSLWQVREKWGSGLLIWPGVTLVVVNADDDILLGKRSDNGMWSVLGGLFETGDSAEVCARRELVEETGLEAEHMHMYGVLTDGKTTHIKYPNGHEVQAPTFLFEVRSDGDVKVGDDEHSEFAWKSIDEARQMFAGSGRISEAVIEMFCRWRETGDFQVA